MSDTFAFTLPPNLVAQYPPAKRDGGRLLHVRGNHTAARQIADLPTLLKAGDLLVVNDSKVLPARLHGRKIPGGGKVEILAERFINDSELLAKVRAAKTPRTGARLYAGGNFIVRGREGEFFRLAALDANGKEVNARRRFGRVGKVPLPPYIRRHPSATDGERYQTLFARFAGSVAAPTAGLHFSPDLLAALRRRGVGMARITLHIGAGTFQPLRNGLSADSLHAERYCVSQTAARRINTAKQRGGRIIAVGTTALRALETAAADGQIRAASGETTLFIKPGFVFHAADLLLTNFHLPRSSLLVLVCAFGGTARVLAAYQQAVAEKFRFYSYGDAMLLDRAI